MNRILILFDVDGTLIERGDPSHLDALDAGFRQHFPTADHISVRQIDFDGKVDHQILRELFRLASPEPVSEQMLSQAVATVGDAYQLAWQGRTGTEDLLPGVRSLLERMDQDERFALGVMTGGLQRVVETKLRRLDLVDYFPIGAFGSEVDARVDLLPLAVKRAEQHFGQTFPAHQVVVIGDTPNDVACAHSGGAACIAVATGRFSVDDLTNCGADLVLSDLSDHEQVVTAILSLDTGSTRT